MIRLILALAFLLAIPASADQQVNTQDAAFRVKKGTLCVAQTATGTCTQFAASGDELVLNAEGYYTFTFDSTASTASTYSCDVYSNSVGHDAASGAGQDMTANAMIETNQIVVLSGLLSRVWIECSAINVDGNVNVVVLMSPLTN